MADDFDPFDDIFGDQPAKKARVVGKFRPKPKFQPQRKVSAKSSVASSQAVQTVHSSPRDLSGPIETAKQLESSPDVLPNDNTKQAGQTMDSASCELSQPIKNAEPLEHGSNAVPNDKTDLHAFVGKSIEENADVLIRSEALAKFSPCANTETVAMDAFTIENIGGRLGTQVLQSGPFQPDSAEKNLIPTFQHDPVDLSSPGFTHTLTTKSASELHLNEESINLREVAQPDSCTHMEGLREVPTKLASRRAKRGNSKTNAASEDPQQQKASASSQENEAGRSLRPRKGNTNFRELVDEDENEILGAEELSEDRPFSSAVDEENINNEQPQVENESQKKNLKRKSKKTDNDKEKSPRKSKKAKEVLGQETHANFRELVDEDGNEILAAEELSFSSAVDDENINNEQPQVENESQKKNLKQKLKKTENDKEKPPRKSKKAKEVLEQDTHAKKKKFSHSTRRRRVDKHLLNIPEDEFDPSEVSLRDLILLAEHREREMKTEQPSAGATATHQSTGEDNGGETEDTTEYFNYQSRMEKTPRVRWSKEDTELFYEAVQQFGTDFSMIAQLFPGRSREQIRNKYKKEERQHPLMLREALTNRCKDLSYFEKVIENLNKIKAKEDENADKDDMEEGATDADDDQAKHERVREEENGDDGDVANDSIKVQSSPLKGEGEAEEAEEAEDYDPWTQYTSDI
ncbi:hypothetical protein C2S51_007932 [Perilla frutescens var. frutescens]|nr:hypothetical protein C2S51_007932 [Perilla frutescens var. frutescens]